MGELIVALIALAIIVPLVIVVLIFARKAGNRKKELVKLREEMEAEINSYSVALENEREKHEIMLRESISNFENERDSLSREHLDMVQKLQKGFEDTLTLIRSQCEGNVAEANRRCEDTVQALTAKYEAELEWVKESLTARRGELENSTEKEILVGIAMILEGYVQHTRELERVLNPRAIAQRINDMSEELDGKIANVEKSLEEEIKRFEEYIDESINRIEVVDRLDNIRKLVKKIYEGVGDMESDDSVVYNIARLREDTKALKASVAELHDSSKDLRGAFDEKNSAIYANIAEIGDTAVAAKAAAETAQVTADEAKTAAEDAKTAVDEVKAAAETAQGTADEAKTVAEDAKTAIDEVKATAETAQATADEAKMAAEDAKTAVDEVKATAETAQITADEAKTVAEDAKTAIDEVKAAAETAQVTADEAKNSAETAQELADEAKAVAEEAQSVVEEIPNTISEISDEDFE